ncbi:MAG: hypothetical protein R2940_14005 [Syntrophotaleaceae bacterium]
MLKKGELIRSAGKLQQPSLEAAKEYEAVREEMAARINAILSRRKDLDALIGPGNLEMMQDNHRNHARFFSSLFTSYSPEVLVETVLWVFRAYRSHGFHEDYWMVQLDSWMEVLESSLSEAAFLEIAPFYRWLIFNHIWFVVLSEADPGQTFSQH